MSNQISDEDARMFLDQVICQKCQHRFTTRDDFYIHSNIIHDCQPTASEIMELLEMVYVTVSKGSS